MLDTAVRELDPQATNVPTLRFLSFEDEYKNIVIDDKTPMQRYICIFCWGC